MRARRLWIIACAAVLAVGLTACGHKEAHPTLADANNNGGYIDAGPVTYQLEISRPLNPYSAEDSQYVKGLPSGTTAPSADEFWYGVFLWAKNQTHHDQTTIDNFEIVDTQGFAYYPIKVDPNVNAFAWTSQTIAPNQIQPGPSTVASDGPTQGGLLLFKLNNDAFSNRPLTLYLLGADNQRLGSISLNL
ncbi:MAG: hypothetical protein JOZ07_14680 [Solirubrobacterales bacterium]|nr:hypothetical protein [Solirubrobacterales bacterium]